MHNLRLLIPALLGLSSIAASATQLDMAPMRPPGSGPARRAGRTSVAQHRRQAAKRRNQQRHRALCKRARA